MWISRDGKKNPYFAYLQSNFNTLWLPNYLQQITWCPQTWCHVAVGAAGNITDTLKSIVNEYIGMAGRMREPEIFARGCRMLQRNGKCATGYGAERCAIYTLLIIFKSEKWRTN